MSTTIVHCDKCGKTNRVRAAADGVPRCGNCHAPLPWIVDAGDDSFVDIADDASVPVLVDLWATWCGPCRMVSPVLERLAHELAGRLKLVKVDIDKAPKLAERFAVQVVPTLLVLNHGEPVTRQAGAAPMQVLRTWVEQALDKVSTPEGQR